MSPPEPRNPFYLLLLVVSLLFVITALAYAVVPVLEQKAREAGNPPPPSPFRDAIRARGGTWLLVELGGIVVLSLASMALDRLRALKKERLAGTMPPSPPSPPPSMTASGDRHANSGPTCESPATADP